MMKYLIVLIAFFAASTIYGSTGGSLPWENPLETLRTSLAGPVAFAISIVGIIAAGAGLIFGGEMGTFMKASLGIVLIVALIVGANAVLSGLFGVSGALIAS